MSKIDENEIQRRLKRLSQIEPSCEASDRAVKRVRDTLTSERASQTRNNMPIWTAVFRGSIAKFAAAVVLLVGAGYTVGRLSAPQPIDVEQLRADLELSLKASLEPTIRQDLVKQMDRRWESLFTASCVQLKEELHQQVRRDLTEFASQTLAASRTLTDRRLIELIQLIEDARMRDRWRVAEALEQIELNRLQDRTNFGKGLQTLVTQTAEWRRTEQN
ncbi:MAG: hypothetical protein AMJ75_03210 [Phycisphaerae bacterium SM1_79]|nr:MAG: hypothetical protein AMJ75_03210 [Phycisphaerae bacterium SM1_79]